jgi:biopolymer transport protein ExbD
MKFSRNVKTEVGIDLTSLIDVVFILLLFFILTTTFTRESTIRITLPEASSEETTQSPLLIEIMVGSNGNYSVNGRTLEQGDLPALMAAIQDLSAGDTTLPISIVADAEAKHQAVVTAMEAVQTLGFTKFGIATRQPEDR